LQTSQCLKTVLTVLNDKLMHSEYSIADDISIHHCLKFKSF